MDDSDTVIYENRDVTLKKGINDALNIIHAKDSKKIVFDILSDFINSIDEELKKLL